MNAPLRSGKLTPFEGGVSTILHQVTLLIRYWDWDGNIVRWFGYSLESARFAWCEVVLAKALNSHVRCFHGNVFIVGWRWGCRPLLWILVGRGWREEGSWTIWWEVDTDLPWDIKRCARPLLWWYQLQNFKVHISDWLPTFLDWANAPASASLQLDGVSQVGQIKMSVYGNKIVARIFALLQTWSFKLKQTRTLQWLIYGRQLMMWIFANSTSLDFCRLPLWMVERPHETR